MSAEALLTVEQLTAGYVGVPVVRRLDLTVRAGEVVALLGPNGAGKTTTLNTLVGLLEPISGSIAMLAGSVRGTGGRQAAALARAGVAYVPDDRGLFLNLTVAENLRLGAGRKPAGLADVSQLFPRLAELASRRAALLSGGEQQMLAIGRALIRRPRLLLIDELSLGLAPVLVREILSALRSIAERLCCGVLVVEQHVDLALQTADRAYVLNHGELALSGDAAALRADRTALHEAYLGTAESTTPPKETT